MTGRLRIASRLAMKDLAHDWLAATCFVAALVGVLTPLLIIVALKNGVIEGMVGRLVEDPSNRELIAVGAAAHDAAFFEALRARDDIAYVTPATRTINASANAIRYPSGRRLLRSVPLIPSSAGDPLLAGASVAPGQVQITQALAEELGYRDGEIEMIIGRDIDGQQQSARALFEVTGIVPDIVLSRPAVFLALPDLLAVERFRDFAEITTEDWRDPRPPPETYASFRLYVSDLSDLATVEADLEAMGVRTRPRAENATLLLAFRRNLNLLYGIIATLAVVGFWAAMAANLRGTVERQRVSFSLLRLIGLDDRAGRLIPAIQSVALVMGGIAASLVLVVPALVLINTVFSSAPGEFVAILGWQHILATLGLGIATALTASVWAQGAIGQIEPDEVLRNA